MLKVNGALSASSQGWRFDDTRSDLGDAKKGLAGQLRLRVQMHSKEWAASLPLGSVHGLGISSLQPHHGLKENTCTV